MKNKCVIFGAGDYFGDESVQKGDFVIAADGGLSVCRKKGIEPDCIIGDFDSLGYEIQGKNVIKLPVVKDDTDTLAAAKEALARGCKIIFLFGCTGGRLSHTIANLQTLTFIAKRGATGFLFDKEEVTLATCKGVAFNRNAEGFLSVFASEEAVTVSETGLKYRLERGVIRADFPLGVSNEFTSEPAAVTVHAGTAFITFPKSEMRFLLWS